MQTYACLHAKHGILGSGHVTSCRGTSEHAKLSLQLTGLSSQYCMPLACLIVLTLHKSIRPCLLSMGLVVTEKYMRVIATRLLLPCIQRLDCDCNCDTMHVNTQVLIMFAHPCHLNLVSRPAFLTCIQKGFTVILIAAQCMQLCRRSFTFFWFVIIIQIKPAILSLFKDERVCSSTTNVDHHFASVGRLL